MVQFYFDPDLDSDNIEIKCDLYGTRTRRLAVQHLATYTHSASDRPFRRKIFDQLSLIQAIVIGSRISIYD